MYLLRLNVMFYCSYSAIDACYLF